jgi:hypothetical protein
VEIMQRSFTVRVTFVEVGLWDNISEAIKGQVGNTFETFRWKITSASFSLDQTRLYAAKIVDDFILITFLVSQTEIDASINTVCV